MRNPPLVIGVAGGSGSGKSTVARVMIRELAPTPVAHVCHDAYYRDMAHLPMEERVVQNFDHPDSLETELLVEHLDALRSGREAHLPDYDFATHTRRPETRRMAPAPVILVEGVLILADPDLRERLDLAIFVDTAADVRLARRIRRDVEERQRSPVSVLDQYEATVRPMHETFVEPSRHHAHIILPEGGHNEVGLRMLVGSVLSFLDRG